MIEDLIFSSKQLNHLNYMEILKPSLEIFYSGDRTQAVGFLNRYEAASSSKGIYFCALSSNNEQISSCVLVEGKLSIDNVQVSIFFLTQVITVEQYRRNGYTRLLLGYVEEFVASMGTPIIIVIARRSVRDLYSKLGFKGFSHFPEFTRISSKEVSKFENYRVADLKDLELLNSIYSEDAEHVYGRIERSLEDWKQILKFQSKSTFEVFLPREEGLKCYVIGNENIVHEVALAEKSKENEDFLRNFLTNFDKVTIDKSNSATPCLSLAEWKYDERFESKEGHLIKVVGKITPNLRVLIDETTKECGAKRLNISVVDQW